MTRPFVTENRISCADIAALMDEELTPDLTLEEENAVSRHLESCPQCERFMKLATNLSRLPFDLSKDELDHAIQRARTRANRERISDRHRAPRWGFIAAASVAALIAGGTIGLISFLSKSPQENVPFQCAPAAPMEPAPGVSVTYCEGDAKPEISVDQGEVRISLPSGAVGLLIAPGRSDRRAVVVDTPHGTVRDKGTVFTVRVEDDNTWIEVFHGLVEVAPKIDGAPVFEVKAGRGADTIKRAPFALTAPKTDMLRRRLTSTPLNESSTPFGEGFAKKKTLPLNEIEPSESAEPLDSRESTSENRRIASQSRRESMGESRLAPKSMYDIIQEAQSCLLEHDWNCAAAQYREVLARYPGRPELSTVLINLAKVELRYLGAPEDALIHYKAYQRRAPNGPLAEEALFGTAEAYRSLGFADEEEAALRRFIDRFPQSTLVRKVRARLIQLKR